MLGGNPVGSPGEIRDADLVEVTVPGITPRFLYRVIAVADPELLAGPIDVAAPRICSRIDAAIDVHAHGSAIPGSDDVVPIGI